MGTTCNAVVASCENMVLKFNLGHYRYAQCSDLYDRCEHASSYQTQSVDNLAYDTQYKIFI